jgi:hypothetical protein
MSESAIDDAIETVLARMRELEQEVGLRDACINSIFGILGVNSRDDAEELAERLVRVMDAHGSDGTTWENEYAGLLDAWARMHPFFKVPQKAESRTEGGSE